MPLLKSLLAPIQIRKMELSNRVVMPPMGTNLGNADGTVSEANIAYLKRRARGGAGLIITEISAVHPNGLVIPSELGSHDDRFIPGLRKLADLIHEAGGKAALQLHHGGRECFLLLKEGKAIAPSPIRSLVYGMTPREMTRDEIREIIFAFGSAAFRAKEAGFDAVEVHGAHGYLLTQFLSALSNQRPDEYGGSLENRSRVIVEVLQEVRRRVGEDFPISLRLSVEEFIKGGYTPEDLQPILPQFVRAGADIIHASLGTHGSPGGVTSASVEYQPGFNVERAKKVKAAVKVPVIAVGRFSDPRPADEVIARGEADLVAFGRQFLADPDFLIKAKEGRFDDIRHCIACNQGCIERLMLMEGTIRCAINPETGQERIYPPGPAAMKRNVWIVGGGPAGLTAAWEAARLGHEVTLFEKENSMGGQLRYASRAPFKKVYAEWGEWLEKQVRKLGIKIQTGIEITEAMISKEKPEAVILAGGGEKIPLEVPGIGLPHVCDAWQILSGQKPAGRQAVIIGGGLIGMETADFLTQKGTKVTIVEVLKRSPVLKITSHGYMLHNRLRNAQAKLLFNTTVARIEEAAVVVLSEGVEEILSPVDQVVVAVGLRPREELRAFLNNSGISHFVVGDAKNPRRIIEATEEGAKAAWDLG
ncbi:MAG: putative NADH:flavin oxidoreductase/NADH oxidase [Deltaproteobacteria bacterium]|nr:putative NADH:flavin oxidoreductase/NADH oxidase [Deltaproteobacteria bacterium]